MLSSSFVDLDDTDRGALIGQVLGLAAGWVTAGQAAVVEIGIDEPVLRPSYQWSDGARSVGATVPIGESFPWVSRRVLDGGETLVVDRLDDLPPEAAADRRSLEEIGVGALAAFPLITAGSPIGALVLSSDAAGCGRSPEAMERLGLLADVVAGALARLRARSTLRKSLAFERFIAELSAGFVDLPADQVDAHVTASLGRVVEFLDLDRSALAQRANDRELLQVTHQWVREDLEPLRLPPHVPQRALPWLNRQWLARRRVVISHVDELPPEAAQDRVFMERHGLKSGAGFPLVVGGEVIGTVSFVTLRRHRTWPAEVVDRLQLVVEVIAGALGRKRDGAALRQHLEFERLIADLSAAFVNLPPEDVDSRVTAALARVGAFLDLDRSHLSQTGPGGSLSITHQWVRAELSHQRTPPHDPAKAVPWICEQMLGGATVTYERCEELPPAAARDLAFFTAQGTRSYAIVPMFVAGEVIGGLSFGTLRHERSWPADVVDRLRLVAEILASALARKRADLELRAALADNERLRQRLQAENVYLQGEVRTTHDFTDVVGHSTPLRAVLHKVSQVAGTDAPVLLLGETGTGKELIARGIHARSARRERPLITVNCAALPQGLIESELFGHEKGAFTGATQARTGRFELADGSTLFLDEIGDLEPALQSKLLRALQGGEIQRVGSSRTLKVDVRIVAATNRDLETAMREGRFRDDLYYRLSVFPIELPPLRERSEDIPLLVWHYIHSRQRALGRNITHIPESGLNALVAYAWPGNVRELQNVIERALILSNGPVLRLDEAFGAMPRRSGPPPRPPVDTAAPPPVADDVRDVERAHLVRVLERCNWNIEGRGRAAERLGLHPSTLRHRMKKLGIRRPPAP